MTKRDLTRYGIDLAVAEAYAQNLEMHLEYVRKFGQYLGVSLWQLLNHDESKWSDEEFPHYAMWFYGPKEQRDAGSFERAFLHHLHCNGHHPEHWVIAGRFKVPGGTAESGVLEMPEDFVLEMVADWQAASMAYAGTPDMTGWLRGALPEMKLHSATRVKVYDVLEEIGYKGVIQELGRGAE